MKLLIVVSSLDLTQPFSATPAWWQLLKGLYEVGVEVIAAPYQGPPIESLWWRAESNPAKFQGDAFMFLRNIARNIAPSKPQSQMGDDAKELPADKMARVIAQNTIAPLWLNHIDKLLTKEPDIDAVIFLTLPLNQLKGVAGEIQRRHQKPVFYYDGDVPASLPILKGFYTGFRNYQGGDVSEFTAFISNSKGGCDLLMQMGAQAAHPLYFGVDPDVFAPLPYTVEQDIDIMYYGHGREYRAEWIDNMITEPSKKLADKRFAVRGKKLGDLGNTEMLPYLSFNKLREYTSRSKINLCITRGAHASVYASSSSRPLELASMRCCIVANPYNGIEEWLEPEKEVIVINSKEEAIDRYKFLLGNESAREAMRQAAYERILKEHTFRHRAQQLTEIIQNYI